MTWLDKVICNVWIITTSTVMEITFAWPGSADPVILFGSTMTVISIPLVCIYNRRPGYWFAGHVYGRFLPSVKVSTSSLTNRLMLCRYVSIIPNHRAGMMDASRLRSCCHGNDNWAMVGRLWERGSIRCFVGGHLVRSSVRTRYRPCPIKPAWWIIYSHPQGPQAR